MKKYVGFIKLLGRAIREAFVLIARGMLGLVYIFVFVLLIIATGIERGFDRLVKAISKTNDKLKAIEFETES